MRTAVLIAAGVVVSALLAGCTSPLESGDVSVQVTLEGPAEQIVGDSVELTVEVELDNGRTDSVIVAVEQRVDDTWLPLATNESVGPSIRFVHTLSLISTDADEFRATVFTADDERVALATSRPVIVTAVDVEAKILQHYLDRNAAYALSTSEGLAFDSRTNIPGVFDPDAPGARAYAEGQIEGAYSEQVTPDVSTLRAAEGFMWPGDNCSESVEISSRGRVFLVTVQVETQYARFAERLVNDQFFIVSDGSLFQFVANCT